MGRNLFIADLHIGSQRIIGLCHRPFRNIDEQDKVITRNWRQAVNEERIPSIFLETSLKGIHKGSCAD